MSSSYIQLVRKQSPKEKIKKDGYHLIRHKSPKKKSKRLEDEEVGESDSENSQFEMLQTTTKENLSMYLPRKALPFFKIVLSVGIILMLCLIYENSGESLQIDNMSIMPSLPQLLDGNFFLKAKPQRITDLMGDTGNVRIRENITTILNHKTFFRESIPKTVEYEKDFAFVFLHDKHTEAMGGTGCCSGLWLWLGTFHRLSRAGFRVVGIDLPGHGFSEGSQLDIRESTPFMNELVKLFQLSKIILVSPSTSVKISLPFASSSPASLVGLVIPSPVTSLKYTNEASMHNLQVPTLITYGADDKNAQGDYEKALSAIPNHTRSVPNTRTVDDGVSLVYLDDPTHFHDELIRFAKKI